MKFNKHALTPVFATVLLLAILFTSVSAIMIWGLPYVENMKAQTSTEQVISQFTILQDAINDMIYSDAYDSQRFELDFSQGGIRFDEDGDRIVLCYSFDENYNFSSIGLDDDDSKFGIRVPSVPPPNNAVTATIFWLGNDPEIFCPCTDDISIIDSTGNAKSYLKFDLTPLLQHQKETSIRILNAEIQLIPKKQIELEKSPPFEVLQISHNNWSSSNQISTFSILPQQLIANATISQSINQIIITNFLDILQKDLSQGKQYFSICIQPSISCATNPLFKINKPMLYGAFHNFNSFYSNEWEDYAPLLRIKYIDILPDHEFETINQSLEKNNSELNEVETPYENDYIEYNSPAGYTAYFANWSKPEQTNLVIFRNGNYILTFTPENTLSYQTISEPKKWISEKQVSFCTNNDNKFSYNAQYGGGFDLQYKCNENLLKEELIISDNSLIPKLDTEYDYFVLTHQIELYTIDTHESLAILVGPEKKTIKSYNSYDSGEYLGSEPLYVVNQMNNIVFTLPEIYAWDNSGEKNIISLQRRLIVNENGTITTSILVPLDWLHNPNLVFPVTIDDTVGPGQIYNLVGSSRNNIKAYVCRDGIQSIYPPENSNYRVYTESEYDNAAYVDASYNIWDPLNVGDHINLWYRFTFDESKYQIGKIVVNWTGYDNDDWNLNPPGNDFFIYVFNQTSAQWDKYDASINTGIDVTLSFEISKSELEYYIKAVGSNSILDLGFLGGTNPALGSYENYFDVSVSTDLTPPTVTILKAPHEHAILPYSNLTIKWQGDDNICPSSQLLYSYNLSGYISDWMGWSSSTGVSYENLPDGNYSFRLRVKDPVGNIGRCNWVNFSVVRNHILIEKRIPSIASALAGDVIYVFTASSPLTVNSSLRIDLYDGIYLFGRIFVFDLGFLEHVLDSTVGSFRNILENNGIILYEPERSYVKKDPICSIEKTDLSFSLRQLINGGLFGDYFDHGNHIFSIIHEETIIREITTDTYNVKLQMYGDYEDEWFEYFNQTGAFQYVDGTSEALMFLNPGIATPLSLSQSIVALRNPYYDKADDLPPPPEPDKDYRKLITIHKEKTWDDLVNFPVLVSTTDTDLRDKAQNDGDDIHFTDCMGIDLDHEIEYYDGLSGELVAWVNVPLVQNDSNTKFYMCYGNETCGSLENPTQVWDSNYVAVYHMPDYPDSDHIKDSTSNNYHGEKKGAMAGGVSWQAAGMVGLAQRFDGDDDYINCSNYTIGGDELTLSAWCYYDEDDPDLQILSRCNSSKLSDLNWCLGRGGRKLEFGVQANNAEIVSDAIERPRRLWYYLTGTYDSNIMKLYLNNSKIAELANSGNLVEDESVYVWIGAENGITLDNPNKEWDGLIDEVRISNIARDANWIKTNYEMMSSPNTFLSFDIEEIL